MPRNLLFKMMILTAALYSMMVPNSWMVIWMPPSPVNRQTSRSGEPMAAPIAAGKPKPMVPNPPDVTRLRLLCNLK
ncbi:MAG: hypothetical protein BWY72_02205 [Bacteroidetes bacterium ADurb.Bin416]|nr:MAG: hypothetical protein BWY72_02205 [Bacteroidetes bacterium ADurb.Bin416]